MRTAIQTAGGMAGRRAGRTVWTGGPRRPSDHSGIASTILRTRVGVLNPRLVGTRSNASRDFIPFCGKNGTTWKSSLPEPGPWKVWPSGFSLIEVLIAIAIFCIVAFAVLQLLITGLGAARSLQIRHADVAVLAAELAMKTNILEEGVDSGDFGDFYPHARWERNTEEVLSNGLFQVDFVVIETVGKNQVVSDMSILLFRPGSPTGKRFGGPAQGLGLKPLP